MERPTNHDIFRAHTLKKSLIIGLLAVAVIFISLQLGFRFGEGFGHSNYHNTYMRYLLSEIYDAKQVVEQGNMDKAKESINRIARLAEVAGDQKQFFEILNEPIEPVDANENLPNSP